MNDYTLEIKIRIPACANNLLEAQKLGELAKENLLRSVFNIATTDASGRLRSYVGKTEDDLVQINIVEGHN